MSETQSRTRITQVGTVMVAVSDQDRAIEFYTHCLLYTSPSPRDLSTSRMPSSA